jgi:GntR family transcriptional regulator, transcriptional repressor for pyruvate dehydrogenase complex
VKQLLRPVQLPTLRKEVVRQIEDLILSGQVKPEEKLPPERDLAERLKVSRPVVHAAIIELEQKGLVRSKPRHGCFVNDYRLSGSAELLVSLWRHGGDDVAPAIVESMMEFRVAVEQEAAARVARVADRALCAELRGILDQADACPAADAAEQTRLDYTFHFTIALRSNNLIYPMLMNTFKPMYFTILTRFFEDPAVVPKVRKYRRSLLTAIEKRKTDRARELMRKLSKVSTYER